MLLLIIISCIWINNKNIAAEFSAAFFTVFYSFWTKLTVGFLRTYALICLIVKVVFTPLPSVTPTASRAETAISITSPAFKEIMKLPLYREATPTASTLDMDACGITVPFLRTDMVTVVPRAADKLV